MPRRKQTIKQDLRVTNWLLLGILLALVAHLGLQLSSTPVTAEMYLPTDPILQASTKLPSEKPFRYIHVVTHNFSGD